MIITFQELISTLNNYWSKQGCNILFPYGLEVAAGTNNPNTFLRAVQFDEWNVAYVEPSRRPADGRYGKNPNRMQYYFQYQIILKPIPANNIDMYLKSLQVIGFDPQKHDIRFVEDNWEAPSIGASGLGWEVWYDGMEISQYTYFQQLGGIKLKQPCLEITLGLERMAMHLQGVDDFKDILWGKGVKYGDMFYEFENQFSKYNFETADVKALREMFNLYEAEAQKCIKNGTSLVAYDYVLKMSHVFNILDARGVVGPSERHNTFSKMRKVVSAVLGELTS